MKNKFIKRCLLVVLCISFVWGIALAADSISVPVSATIPAVPGLNAPPFNDGRTSINATEDTARQAESTQTKSIQQENIKQTELGMVSVQTIYTR